MAASEDGSGCLVSRGRSQSDPSFLSDSSATSTDAGENPGTGPGGGGRAGWGRQEAGGMGTASLRARAPPAFTGNGRFRRHRGPWLLSPSRGGGGWGASEPFVQRGTALPGRAGCSAVCSVRRVLGIASPAKACCPGVQLTAQRKGPRATSSQGWCLLCPPSRPCVPVFCTPRVRVALHCCGHRAQGCHWTPGLQQGLAHLGTPASRDRCAGQSCCGEMKGVCTRQCWVSFYSVGLSTLPHPRQRGLCR